tara:strand:- start:286 stop:3696 length:3411 start_codon:yes stop_codon:yes gene_type:complete
MPNITQTIPALTAGISQQPDEQKIPGQVKDMENAIPDVTQGLLKRPAGKFIKSLSDFTDEGYPDPTYNSDTTGKWFHYYRDETEQYIGQIARDGTVRMWDCLTGNPKNVVDTSNTRVGHGNSPLYTYADGTTGTKYLKHSNDEDLQTLTLNDFTYINNRQVTVEMDDLIEPDTNFKKEMFIELKSIAYAKQYALNLYSDTTLSTVTTATRIHVELIGSSNNYGTTAGYLTPHSLRDNYTQYNDIESNGDDKFNPTDETAGDGRDEFAPNVGTRIFDITDDKILIDENAIGGITYNNNNPVEIGSLTYNSTVTETNEFGVSQSMSSKGDNFKYSINVKNAAGQNVSTQTNRTRANGLQPTNLYFRIKNTGQSVPFSKGSGDNLETKYKARYTTTYDLLHGGENWQEGDYFFLWMKDAYYKVTVEAISTSIVQANLGLVRPNPTPFDNETTITAESILGDIRKGITGSTNGTTGRTFITEQIGTGLYIRRPDPFNASTSYIAGDYVTSLDTDGEFSVYLALLGGTANATQPSHTTGVQNNWSYHSKAQFNGNTPVGELLNVVAGKVSDAGDLPTQCKHGMVVEVINSAAEEDNYFVKFEGYGDRDGEGIWAECAKPGRKVRIRRDTMPLVLIRTADGNFRLTELNESTYNIGGVQQPTVPFWDDALVGDKDTNPEPSFVGKTINKMLFFRNRFGILSEENIVLSRAGDFTNFFQKSAIQFIASDPIDISASSEYPADLFDGIQVNTGLVLFTRNQQFMLTTDSDTFSPLTAKINALSSYNFNEETNPISLGTTIGFLDNAGKHSRFFEMANILREGEPVMIEQSAVVSKLFETDLKLISNSRENSVLFFSGDRSSNNGQGTSTLYGFRYFDQIDERKLASWFKWTLTGTIQYHCMQDDNLFVVVRNGSNNKNQLLKFSLKMDSNTLALAENRVHLDHVRETSGWTYDPTIKKSYKLKTDSQFIGLESSNQLAVYDNTNATSGTQNLGRYALVSEDNTKYLVDGDWENETFLIGYQYTMKVTLPTIYYVTQSGKNWRSDTRANTIVHRVKIGFGPVGLYKTILSRTGKTDYTEQFELTTADSYIANTAGIVNDNNLRTIPIFERNINAELSITSTHPAPATIHNMTWEGVWTSNNYERV